MSDKDKILSYIHHFHPNEKCGWDIIANSEDHKLIKKEFPYLELYESGVKDTYMVRLIGTMSIEHDLLYYKDMYEVYKNEADRFYNGMTRLLNG